MVGSVLIAHVGMDRTAGYGLKLTGAFRLGGNVDDAFDYGIDTLIRGLMSRPG